MLCFVITERQNPAGTKRKIHVEYSEKRGENLCLPSGTWGCFCCHFGWHRGELQEGAEQGWHAWVTRSASPLGAAHCSSSTATQPGHTGIHTGTHLGTGAVSGPPTAPEVSLSVSSVSCQKNPKHICPAFRTSQTCATLLSNDSF